PYSEIVPALDQPALHWTEEQINDLSATMQRQRQRLTQLMWEAAAISRSQDGLESAIAALREWRAEIKRHPLQALHTLPASTVCPLPKALSGTLVRAWGELCNLHDIAWLILTSAAFRTESRGGHFRRDYPQASPEWQVHTVVAGDRWATSPPIE
ncbi:MAG: L-aspartate oxidase, partial [Nodosilinea sp.]